MDFSSFHVCECSLYKAEARSNENCERAFIFTVSEETNLVSYSCAFFSGFFSSLFQDPK